MLSFCNSCMHRISLVGVKAGRGVVEREREPQGQQCSRERERWRGGGTGFLKLQCKKMAARIAFPHLRRQGKGSTSALGRLICAKVGHAVSAGSLDGDLWGLEQEGQGLSLTPDRLSPHPLFLVKLQQSPQYPLRGRKERLSSTTLHTLV